MRCHELSRCIPHQVLPVLFFGLKAVSEQGAHPAKISFRSRSSLSQDPACVYRPPSLVTAHRRLPKLQIDPGTACRSLYHFLRIDCQYPATDQGWLDRPSKSIPDHPQFFVFGDICIETRHNEGEPLDSRGVEGASKCRQCVSCQDGS